MAISTVSYMNTPQATDDTWGYHEDYFNSINTLLLDVLANDLGGNAKKLYSIDDGDGALKDLVSRDPNLLTAWKKTDDGDLIHLNNGKVEFRFADGTAEKTITVRVTGINDLASIDGTASGAVAEDGSAYAEGKLDVTDVDRGQSRFDSVDAGALNGKYGKFSFDADGNWTYTLDNLLAQELRGGEKAEETLTVKSFDGSAQQTIVVHVHDVDEPIVQPPAPVRALAPVVYTGADDPNDFDSATGMATTPDGTKGSDTLVGTDGANTLNGGAGNDTTYGGENNDEIYGGSGHDLIYGNANNDSIFGGSGSDTIEGNENNDVIVGGFGADTLSGNGGADTFKFLSVKDTGDTITDFGDGADKFDFSAIDANTNTSSDDVFLLAGESVGLSAYSVNWFYEGGDTYIQFDNDGNASSAEFEIKLSGTVALDSPDFLL